MPAKGSSTRPDYASISYAEGLRDIVRRTTDANGFMDDVKRFYKGELLLDDPLQAYTDLKELYVTPRRVRPQIKRTPAR
jgi:hypothetical protein